MLRSYNRPGTKVRKWFVNPAALRSAVEKDPEENEVALGEHLLRIEALERNLQALRNSHIALKRKVNSTAPLMPPTP